MREKQLSLVEICAGAGGQALGLEQAGFQHDLAVELDHHACETLRANLGEDRVREGDVADGVTWKPSTFADELDLLAGGVPCPPFSIAGKQRGATDERDLFAWAVEQVAVVRPRALLLENVRGLAAPRFGAYRQHVADTLRSFGYETEWRLLQASDYGVAQLRPRFVLVALQSEYWPYFSWPTPEPTSKTVGSELLAMMEQDGWEHAKDWSAIASSIAPTVVGGSKKHGGADLGPTRAKQAWRALGVDGHGLADAPPKSGDPHPTAKPPRLTVEMVARLQGWQDEPAHRKWMENLAGRKTAKYRQIGNAFPPPVARAVGDAIASALRKESLASSDLRVEVVHDPVFRVLAAATSYLTAQQISAAAGVGAGDFAKRLKFLEHDFIIDVVASVEGPTYRLGAFRAFTGQEQHPRNEYIQRNRSRVS